MNKENRDLVIHGYVTGKKRHKIGKINYSLEVLSCSYVSSKYCYRTKNAAEW